MLHNLPDIQGDGTAHHASSAAHTGVFPIVALRIITELVADAVAHALELFRAGIVPAGFQREQRRHAGIPAADTPPVKLRPFIGDGEALAGRAQIGAGPAGQALFRFLDPEGLITEAGRDSGRNILQSAGRTERGFRLPVRGFRLVPSVLAGGEASRLKQLGALFRDGFQHKAAVHGREQDIGPLASGGRTAHPMAETGGKRRGAGLGNDHQGFTPGGVVRILEPAFKVGAIQHHKTPGVAGTAAEQHSGNIAAGRVQRGIQPGRVFGVLGRRKTHQSFTVGNDRTLGGRRGAAQKFVHIRQFVRRAGTEHHAAAFPAGSQHAIIRGQLFQPAKEGVRSGKVEGAHDSSCSLMLGSSTW